MMTVVACIDCSVQACQLEGLFHGEECPELDVVSRTRREARACSETCTATRADCRSDSPCMQVDVSGTCGAILVIVSQTSASRSSHSAAQHGGYFGKFYGVFVVVDSWPPLSASHVSVGGAPLTVVFSAPLPKGFTGDIHVLSASRTIPTISDRHLMQVRHPRGPR